jgi:cytoskeletal protein RodZ
MDDPVVDNEEPIDEQHWHDSRHAVIAAGAAAVLLLVILVWAVVRMAGDATRPRQFVPLGPSVATSPSTTGRSTSSSTSTSYGMPSVQTSEATPAPAPPPSEAPTEDAPEPETSTTPSASTTIFNPYVTTTQPAAGHV